MSEDNPLVTSSIVEFAELEIPNTVIKVTRPYTVPSPARFRDPANPDVKFSIWTAGRWADPTHYVATVTVQPRTEIYGRYQGTARFQVCQVDWEPCPPYLQLPDVASASLPFDITVTEMTTTVVTPEVTIPVGGAAALGGVTFAWLRVDSRRFLTVNSSYHYSVTAGPMFTNVRFEVNTAMIRGDVPPATPAGQVTGNLMIKVCRDDPAICAFPRKGSPFNVPITVTVR